MHVQQRASAHHLILALRGAWAPSSIRLWPRLFTSILDRIAVALLKRQSLEMDGPLLNRLVHLNFNSASAACLPASRVPEGIQAAGQSISSERISNQAR